MQDLGGRGSVFLVLSSKRTWYKPKSYFMKLGDGGWFSKISLKATADF